MSARSKLVLTVLAAVAINALFFTFAIRPRQGELGTIRKDIEAEQNRTTQLQAELSRLQSLQANAPKLQAQISELREAVPEQHEVANFIFQVQEAADAAGLRFVQIDPESPKQPPEGASLAEVRATIGARGGYFAIQDFARRLYELDRALRIDVFTMEAEEDDEEIAQGNTVTLTIVARIFFELPEGAVTTAVPGTTGTTTAATSG